MDILSEFPASRIYLQRSHWREMLADVEDRSSEEACGLVAGIDGKSTAVIPLINSLHNRFRYQIDPVEQFRAFQLIDENGWELLAIYHSHLGGPAIPSPTDVNEATYPEVAYLIWSRPRGLWECQGFQIDKGNWQKIPVDLIEDI